MRRHKGFAKPKINKVLDLKCIQELSKSGFGKPIIEWEIYEHSEFLCKNFMVCF